MAEEPAAKDLVVEGTIVGARELLWEQVSQARGNCVEDCKARSGAIERRA